MYAILGEDKSDVEMLATLVRRIKASNNVQIRKIGFDGSGELIKKGARHLRNFGRLGCDRFIICYDSDNDDPNARYKKIVDDVITTANVAGKYCILIPIKEIESWLLADLESLTNIIKSWRPDRPISNPEHQDNPKEHIKRITCDERHRPRYNNATHNPILAQYLCLKQVAQKCPSSIPLFEFIKFDLCNFSNQDNRTTKERTKNILESLGL